MRKMAGGAAGGADIRDGPGIGAGGGGARGGGITKMSIGEEQIRQRVTGVKLNSWGGEIKKDRVKQG